ncbi:prkA protein [Sulfobacillus acidophilus TPY]|uniref:Serine protein kinase, PrkA n=1 Tax=Sulfobacillus acidophilus (strain ATCC 700253 / DSM 10332 / NAL) TaxID=679936 RepID=G8TT74_SULAD|nr:prkA protein [Sulfobacillus acidophilus TPY]AEW06774.1 putative serine protein kinase, PrkA [Sulfobacillus acidophilus DSM 10332]
MDLMERLVAHQRESARLTWRGSFAEYLAIVRERPQVAQLSHARINAMIQAAGIRETREGREYPFFDGQLFGLAPQIRHIMEYFEAAARRLDVRKRVLLLIGPPGTGKSTFLVLLKRGLEAYTRTDEGAVYGIVGCPMHEEPLHLIPQALREEFRRELGVVIEGELCPVCQWRWRESGENVEAFEVERIVFSERDRVGIGTFTPGDPKDLDTALLTGSLDFSKIAEYGSESDPRAFRFDGEFNVANRGLMEEQEWLKQPKDFMALLLTLAQEQNIKTGRFALIYADEAIIAHSNLHEYEKFIANPENEAMKNRVYVVTVPYTLRIADEEKIYRKMLEDGSLGHTHLAPDTLSVAAWLTVLTRLSEPKDKAHLTLLDKAKLYNGEAIQDFKDHQLDELRREDPREGMVGLSPRDAMNILVHAMGKTGVPCVNPLDYLQAAKSFAESGRLLSIHGPEAQKRFLELIHLVRGEYDKTVQKVVMKAFVHAFDESAQTLFVAYMDHAEADIAKTRLPDPITGELRDPDVEFLRTIEEQMGVSAGAAKSFREELLIKAGAAARKGQPFRWNDHPLLAEGIERKLFSDVRALVRTTTSTKTPDEQQRVKIAAVTRQLEEEGYCPHCAGALLQYAGSLLNRK